MIIGVRLMGGLGNMLFQIAFGESMAQKYNCDIVYTNLKENFDYIKTYYNRSPYASEYLSIFPNVDWIKNQSRLKEITKTKHVPFHYVEVIPEDGTEYVGYYQSEKYFFSGDFIRWLFTFRENISIPIHGGDTVSIHVRRADYLTMPDFHPVQPITYYQSALDILEAYDYKDCLVFSDDKLWCEENFGGDRFIVVQNKDYQDLSMMTQCRYHIIANSSMSWWGAYLCGWDKPVVIAPKHWFGDKCKDNPRDIIPPTWVQI